MASLNPAARAGPPDLPKLKRSVSVPILTLYGLGTTIGAGIYVLVGAAAGEAGLYTPFAFMFAAIVMSFSAASFAELAGRFPVSAGEAAYVRAGFGPGVLPLAVGLMVAASGIISSAALVQGGAGYLKSLIDLPARFLVMLLPLLIGAIAAWGITESLRAAALLTLIEIAGLLLIIAGGGGTAMERLPDLIHTMPDFDMTAAGGLLGAGLLAFFAFIGFEDMVNVAEETIEPERTIPRAIGLTLVLTTVLYLLVSTVAIATVSLEELAGSSAPLSLVFERAAGAPGWIVSLIAVAAVLNGVLIQMVMASRVLYGLARLGNLPAALGTISPLTRTPLVATGVVIACVFTLAASFPLDQLASMTSILILIVFSLVNLALWRLKRTTPPPVGHFTVPRWLPLTGFAVSVAFLLAEALRRMPF